jgi:predicted AAA+ superfamily ATPase
LKTSEILHLKYVGPWSEQWGPLHGLQAFDKNKKQGFPRKARKFHISDPFILHTISHWLQREGYLNVPVAESILVESCVASQCRRLANTFYFKGAQGEIDIIWLKDQTPQAIEVKWATQIRPADLKTIMQFKNSIILTKLATTGMIDNIKTLPAYTFLSQI